MSTNVKISSSNSSNVILSNKSMTNSLLTDFNTVSTTNGIKLKTIFESTISLTNVTICSSFFSITSVTFTFSNLMKSLIAANEFNSLFSNNA